MFSGYPGKEGAVYHKHDAFCVETQHYPNSVNQSQFPSPFYPGKHTFSSTTAFRFFTF
jgi:aldose 1-epimerase